VFAHKRRARRIFQGPKMTLPLVPEDLKPHRNSIRELSMRSLARSAVCVGLHALDGSSVPSSLSPADFLRQRGFSIISRVNSQMVANQQRRDARAAGVARQYLRRAWIARYSAMPIATTFGRW
jgi:hypothetical protein